MSELLESLVSAKDSTVEALGTIWGERGFRRRTRGNPRRTLALVALDVMAHQLDLPECDELARTMSDAWAGEDGWDTIQLIKALGATKGASALVREAVRRGERE